MERNLSNATLRILKQISVRTRREFNRSKPNFMNTMPNFSKRNTTKINILIKKKLAQRSL